MLGIYSPLFLQLLFHLAAYLLTLVHSGLCVGEKVFTCIVQLSMFFCSRKTSMEVFAFAPFGSLVLEEFLSGSKICETSFSIF